MNADFILNLSHSQSICVKFNPQKWIPLEILIIFLFFTFKIRCLVQKLALKDFHWAPCSWDRAHGTERPEKPKNLKSKKLEFLAKICEFFFWSHIIRLGLPVIYAELSLEKNQKWARKSIFSVQFSPKMNFDPILIMKGAI